MLTEIPCSFGLSVTSTFLSEQTSHQQSANNTFFSQQISTSHQPPAKRTGWISAFFKDSVLPLSLPNSGH
jgi:hypothetical protein